MQHGGDSGCSNGWAGVCDETVEDGGNFLLMSVCGSAGGRGTFGSGMGYHGNIVLKTNAGGGEAEVKGLI